MKRIELIKGVNLVNQLQDRLLMVYILNNNVPKIARAQKVHHVVHIKSKSRVQNLRDQFITLVISIIVFGVKMKHFPYEHTSQLAGMKSSVT
jgi:hypothetical protein